MKRWKVYRNGEYIGSMTAKSAAVVVKEYAKSYGDAKGLEARHADAPRVPPAAKEQK
jgi:hypothetical protein